MSDRPVRVRGTETERGARSEGAGRGREFVVRLPLVPFGARAEAGIPTAEMCPPDVVLLHIGLPTLNGYAVCCGIRAQAWAFARRWLQRPSRHAGGRAPFTSERCTTSHPAASAARLGHPCRPLRPCPPCHQLWPTTKTIKTVPAARPTTDGPAVPGS